MSLGAAPRCSSKALAGIAREGWDLNPSEIIADTYHHFVCSRFSGERPVSFVFACLPGRSTKNAQQSADACLSLLKLFGWNFSFLPFTLHENPALRRAVRCM